MTDKANRKDKKERNGQDEKENGNEREKKRMGIHEKF